MPTGWQVDGSYVPCGACGWKPSPEREMVGKPIRMPGTTHLSSCPTIPRLSAEDEAELRRDLEEMDHCRRRAMADAANYWIG